MTLTTAVWAVGPIRPSLVRGLRPRNAPSPTTCLVDRVSTLVTSAQSKVLSQTTSPQSHQIPAGAGLVPALARPTDELHPRLGTHRASRQNTLNIFIHRRL